jgi:nicotinamide-nucleotide amidase
MPACSKLHAVSALQPIADQDLYQLAEEVGRRARASGWRIVTAESCTAGWIAKALTDVPGSSQWVDSGYVTYSNAAKMRDVGVSAGTLTEHGAVSEATVREMANGALRAAGVELAIAVSGIAGPDGGTAEKPVGTVWFAIATAEAQGPAAVCELRQFSGDREQVRRQAVDYALRLALRLLRTGGGL